MGFYRTYRLAEASLVALFFIQAVRLVLAPLLALSEALLSGAPPDPRTLTMHVFLLLALSAPWLAPRRRTALPNLLSVSAVAVALARAAAAVPHPDARYYGGLIVFGAGGIYFASLLRANWRSWVAAWVVGLSLDQMLRARDTFDLSLRTWFEISAAGGRYAVPWLAVQVALSLLLIVASRLARGSARREPFAPAHLYAWGGLALGGFLAVETSALGVANVLARWTDVPYAGLAPWLVLVTALPLLPGVRAAMAESVAVFDRGLRGWVWLGLLLMLIVAGNRLSGVGAAASLLIAQLMAVMLLWWLPQPASRDGVEQVGPATGVAMAALVVLVYVYNLAFQPGPAQTLLQDRGIVVLLAAVVLLALPSLLRRQGDMWLVPAGGASPLALAFIAPAAVAVLLIAGLVPQPSPVVLGQTLRAATYNLNSGYSGAGMFELELAARTVEAARPDIVLLQEIDGGHPASYGIDEVEYLARRLGMYHAFFPTAEQVRGLAILSRWPLTDARGTLLPGAGARGGVLAARIEDAASNTQVRAATTRFPVASAADAEAQASVVLGAVLDSERVVLGADLGALPGSRAYDVLLLGGMVDPDTVLSIGPSYTVPAENPTVRHDYLLLTGLAPIDSRQVESTASDHRLVVVEAALAAP